MSTADERAHGTTPGFQHVNAARTADKQAAFLLAHLKPGISLLDCGCGPGTITLGLAQRVAPGRVVGIDHDTENVRLARELADNRGLSNVTFRTADVYELPFHDATFDVAFENNLFIHLSDAVKAASEIGRVIKPGGLIAVRDTGGLIVGSPWPERDELQRVFDGWQKQRGSTMGFGNQLVAVLIEAGYTDPRVSVSADLLSGSVEAQTEIGLLNGSFGKAMLEQGTIDEATRQRWISEIENWSRNPASFFANVHVEVIGRKPA
jgi:SAM-dependent methyltransferase